MLKKGIVVCVLLLGQLMTVSGAFNENDLKGFKPSRFRVIPELSASASAQFSKNQLALILNEIVGRQGVHPSRIVFLDFREEAHLFADGLPFTPTDKHESPSKAYQYEKESDLQKIFAQMKTLYIEPRKRDIDKHMTKLKTKSVKVKHAKKAHTKPLYVKNPLIETEEELVKLYGAQYKRIPLTDHMPPDRAQLEAIANFLKSLPTGTWVHVHCRGGEGRTTSVLALLEMLKFQDRSFESIIKHQHEAGGKNLAKIPEEEDRKQPAIDRLKVLHDLYDGIHA